MGILDSFKDTVSTLTSTIGGKFNDIDINIADSRINSVLALYSKHNTDLINPRIEIRNSELFLLFSTHDVFMVDIKVRLNVSATLNIDSKIISCTMLGLPVITTTGFFKNKLVWLYNVVSNHIFRVNPIIAKLKRMQLGGVSIHGKNIQIDIDDAAVDAALGPYKHTKHLFNVLAIESVRCKDSNIVVTMTPFPKKGKTVNF